MRPVLGNEGSSRATKACTGQCQLVWAAERRARNGQRELLRGNGGFYWVVEASTRQWWPVGVVFLTIRGGHFRKNCDTPIFR
jgi:hypothetical protein